MVGNQLQDGSNKAVQLRGVNYSGTEYACIQGWGTIDGPSDDAMVAAIASWHVSVVHIGLNEDCILGINGVNPACTIPDPGSKSGKKYETLGEALFNLGLSDNFAAGAYSCGRCHTKGWSYGQPEVPGGGALGPNITGGSELRQFELAQSQVDFVSKGSELGKRYGRNGNGSGQMPGFGLNPNAELKGSLMSTNQTMYNQEQIAAIVAYERSL